jgi:ribosomal-protein-alanine N-acetyltransferase
MEFPTRQTPDLRLREILPVDAPAIQQIRSNPEILEFMDRESLESSQAAKAFIRTLSENFCAGKGVYWGLAFKSSGELIGTGGFHRWERATSEAEIAYELLPQYWRRGFISQALREMLEFGFCAMELQKIVANVNPQNVASRCLLEKFDFRQVACLKENFYFNGAYLDTAVYWLLKRSF